MINRENIWNRLFQTISNNIENSYEILDNITKNEKINNMIFSFYIKNIGIEYSEEFLINIFNNKNKISYKLILKMLPLKKMLPLIKKSIKNNDVIIKQELIDIYISENETLKFNEIVYILKNYNIEQDQVDKLFKNNYLKIFNEIYEKDIEIEEFYTEGNTFDDKKIKVFFNTKRNLFYYFLKQKKINDNLKDKLENFYLLQLKYFLLYSIEHNRFTILQRYFLAFKYIDIDKINEFKDILTIFFEFFESENTKNNLNLLKIKKIQQKIEEYLFFNEEYQEENDFEYYLENNLKNINFYDFISVNLLIELLETFIYEEDVDKLIFTFKILTDKILSDDEKKDIVDLLTHEYFYDINDKISVNFRKIFIDIFDSFDIKLNPNIEEEYRLIDNINYLYEKMYYKNIDFNNIKYIMRKIKKEKIFYFLYKNDLFETFFQSSEVSKYDIEFLNNLIIDYNDKINNEKIYLNDYQKSTLKYNIIGNLLENPDINKDNHFKFFKFYIHNEYLKRKLLSNKNLSIIVLYKSINNIKEISYLVENKNIW